MSLNTFVSADPNAPQRLVLEDPRTGEETDFYIDMHGPESDVAKEYDRKVGQASINKMFKKRSAIPTYDDEQRKTNERLAAMFTDWNLKGDDGKKMELTKDNAIETLRKSKTIREQASAFHADVGNFM